MSESPIAVFKAVASRCGIGFGVTPALVLLGLLTALTDAATVGLVVALLFALLSQAPSDGLPGQILAVVGRTFGGGWPALTLCLLLLVLAKVAVSFAYQAATIRFKNRINARVLAAIHGRLLDIRYQDLRARGQGELLNVAATESWQVANAAHLLSRIAINACTIAVFTVLILAMSWIIAASAVVGVAVTALSGQFLSRAARAAGVRARRSVNALYVHILAAVQAPRLVRAFAAEDADKRRFDAHARQLQHDMAHAETIQSLTGLVNELAYVMLLVALVGIARAAEVPDASALTAIALIYRLTPHTREIAASRNTFAGLYAPLAAVRDLLTHGHIASDRRQATGEGRPASDERRPSGTISFEDVSFQPPGAAARALDAVSFSIPHGAVTFLSGPSGAGKTSIVNLLLRLYEPDSGQIRIGSTPLDSVPRRDWLARLAVAGQDMDLLEGTIADNLRLASGEASADDLREAAAVAGALPFIDALPDGFDTWVGSFGYNLSGGQRQRLSIARAVLRRPDVLILDEGTNAIEDTLERQVLDAIRRRLPDATLLVISHRPYDLAAADCVVRLERGRVVPSPEPGPWSPEPEWRRPARSEGLAGRQV